MRELRYRPDFFSLLEPGLCLRPSVSLQKPHGKHTLWREPCVDFKDFLHQNRTFVFPASLVLALLLLNSAPDVSEGQIPNQAYPLQCKVRILVHVELKPTHDICFSKYRAGMGAWASIWLHLAFYKHHLRNTHEFWIVTIHLNTTEDFSISESRQLGTRGLQDWIRCCVEWSPALCNHS